LHCDSTTLESAHLALTVVLSYIAAVTNIAALQSKRYSNCGYRNNKLLGRPCQYGYFTYFDAETADPGGVVKVVSQLSSTVNTPYITCATVLCYRA
jgi:hypothetical protein